MLRDDRENPRAIPQLGLAYFEAGDLAVAYRFLLRAQEQKPDDLEVRQELGLLYLADRKNDEASAEARYILDRDPKDLEAVMLLAGPAGTPAEIDEALGRLRAGQSDFGALARYHLALGMLRWRHGGRVLGGVYGHAPAQA